MRPLGLRVAGRHLEHGPVALTRKRQLPEHGRAIHELLVLALTVPGLQQAVEGLSVVAISYYSIGLVSYAGKALKAAGVPLNPDVLTGVAIPLLVGAVWLGLRRMHHQAVR